MSKSPDAFRTISEVAEWLGIPAHVLRFWESKFTQIKPVKRAGGRRYYRPSDMSLLGGIKRLLHDEGQSIKQVQALLREQGASHVAQMSASLDEALDPMPVVETDDTIVPFAEPEAPASAPEQIDMLLDVPDETEPVVVPEQESAGEWLTAEDESLSPAEPSPVDQTNGFTNGAADTAPCPQVVNIDDVADDAFIVDHSGVLAQLAKVTALAQNSQAEALICFDELRALAVGVSDNSVNS